MQCGADALLAHLSVVLYECLGEEYPDVLGSILGGLKGVVAVIGMTAMQVCEIVGGVLAGVATSPYSLRSGFRQSSTRLSPIGPCRSPPSRTCCRA